MTDATMEEQKQEGGSQSLQITCQLDLKIKRYQLGNSGILKTTSGNAAKR